MTWNRWILLFACLAGGLAALNYGFVLEWDLLNYHLYNPHALLTGRLAIDVAPAQQQSFLNPAFFIPGYLIFMNFGAAPMVFVIGAIQAGQLLLLFLILQELTGHRITGRWMLLVVAALGLGGPIFLNQLGGSQGDSVLSIPVLGGLLVVLRDLGRPDGSKTLRAGVLAGLMLGAAFALKLTLGVYAVSLGVAAFIFFSGSRRWRITAGLILGGILGVALAGGPWFFYLWQTYGNPLFPFFNDVFDSPWIGSSNFRDQRFLPGSALEWFFYPVFWMVDPSHVWEVDFFDLRVPLVIALAFVLPLVAWRRMREQVPALGLTLIFIGLSYVLWIRMFSIYRYLSVVELLAPLVIFGSIALFAHSRRALVIVLLALVGSQALVSYHPGSSTWELQPDTATSLDDLPADAMVLIDGHEPFSFLALWMDDDIPLVRIRANFMNGDDPEPGLQEYAYLTAKRHAGPHFLLASQADLDGDRLTPDLARIGLALQPEACVPVFDSETLQQKLGPKLCPLEKLR